ENLAQLVDRESDRVADLAEQVDALTAEVARLSRTGDAPAAVDPDLAARTALAAGTTPVTGRGVSVTLDDAPREGDDPPQIRRGGTRHAAASRARRHPEARRRRPRGDLPAADPPRRPRGAPAGRPLRRQRPVGGWRRGDDPAGPARERDVRVPLRGQQPPAARACVLPALRRRGRG